MTFVCDSCGKNRDFMTEYGIAVITAHQEYKRYCRICRAPQSAVPDVYWDGKPEENLADDPNTGKPRIFASKREKAEYLRSRGIMEAGDRVHGAPIMVSKSQEIKPHDSRHEVMMALKRVKEMGRDVRRQEYLKIKKEGQQYAKR